MADAVRSICRTTPIDRIVATQLDMAPYAIQKSVPALLEELEIGIHHDAPRRAASPAGRIRASLTWWKLRGYLRRTLPRFAACTVVSERERRQVRTAVPTYDRVQVIPNAIDLARYQGDFGTPAPGTLIHTGAMTYDANRDAVDHFLRHILPLVHTEQPHTHMRVTGAAPASAVTGLPPSTGVEFTGHVPDIRPVIAQSWLSVVPLRIGGGTRLKLLESLALGTPVVATPKGAEGLIVHDGRELLIGATPPDFARAVIAVLRSPELRARLAYAGRERVETTYNWTAIGQDLLQLVESLPNSASNGTATYPLLKRGATAPGSEPV
jgi:glycosyltransferase involved in cell wall biosynthesis